MKYKNNNKRIRNKLYKKGKRKNYINNTRLGNHDRYIYGND